MFSFYSMRIKLYAGKSGWTLDEVLVGDYQTFILCMPLAVAGSQLSASCLPDIHFEIYQMPLSLTAILPPGHIGKKPTPDIHSAIWAYREETDT